ncbi:MAG: hypothetical protein Q9162_005248 [Coniocarpon cinnabarinum]
MAQDQLQFNKLQGARVLVLGGTSGLGFSVARLLIESHASSVVLASSKTQSIENAISRLQSLYPNLITTDLAKKSGTTLSGTTCDLSSLHQVESNLKSLLDFATDNGSQKLDHIVHTAAAPGGNLKPLDQTTAADFEAGIVRNAGIALLVKLAVAKKEGDGEGLKYLKGGRGCSITVTGGNVDVGPQPNWHIRSVSAGGVIALVKNLALVTAPVRVNVVSPGAIDTELWGKMGMSSEQVAGLKSNISQQLPLKSMGHPEDVAESYRCCMCDYNFTGMVLRTEGGSGLGKPLG